MSYNGTVSEWSLMEPLLYAAYASLGRNYQTAASPKVKLYKYTQTCYVINDYATTPVQVMKVWVLWSFGTCGVLGHVKVWELLAGLGAGSPARVWEGARLRGCNLVSVEGYVLCV